MHSQILVSVRCELPVERIKPRRNERGGGGAQDDAGGGREVHALLHVHYGRPHSPLAPRLYDGIERGTLSVDARVRHRRASRREDRDFHLVACELVRQMPVPQQNGAHLITSAHMREKVEMSLSSAFSHFFVRRSSTARWLIMAASSYMKMRPRGARGSRQRTGTATKAS